MRAILRMLVLGALITAGVWTAAAPLHAQTPTDTAETPTDTAETDDTTDDTQDTTADTSGDTEARAQTEDDDLPTTGVSVWLFGASGLAMLFSGSALLGVDRRIQASLPTAYWEAHTDR